jgi:hypothetical protein
VLCHHDRRQDHVGQFVLDLRNVWDLAATLLDEFDRLLSHLSGTRTVRHGESSRRQILAQKDVK